MEDPFLSIGSVVIADVAQDEISFMVIGHRIINYESMRAWDYVAVDYPGGLKRYFNSDKSFDCDQLAYFNHQDIIKVVHEAVLVELEIKE